MDDRSASILELKALSVPQEHYDVAVLGGGLAGLTVALQIKRARPETRVLVTDKRTEPAPEAAFKVGESSVEIGVDYYREIAQALEQLPGIEEMDLEARGAVVAG
jgi:2-polyprenyl-6-methoxyphenol hydroxylase-like FAD-dependent oxidoreductase